MILAFILAIVGLILAIVLDPPWVLVALIPCVLAFWSLYQTRSTSGRHR